ncbi:Lipoprotein [Vibrio crassostreae]|uniref:hypothetical protein n=1 Tax=Vibrio crassostreae TaxID=246167 RepID=UPI0005DFF462|nr:hypothetical protein [Vibrio crassostreae]ROO56695.1 hypothetical protein EDB58_104252 [Vibrio crassostreae]ROO57911.1 hypothetical protein EDB56_1011059 [Vibrio crassostreae]ROO74257.1 hypothetical protein EDB57_0686 [Vibrio crassostreae]ROO76818.1 hypothetical protein EDB53_0646 [Vibrio crassostreae]ROP24400.1 hypothetical protein EDB33_102519 [Vibrio crassostreae]
MTRFVLVLLFAIISSGCGTSDSALIESGHNESYIQGFHDGRHSGMQEAGNDFENYMKDEKRFDSDTDYKQGWLAGESEGKKLQDEATSIGKGIAGSYPQKTDSTNTDDMAKDALKGIDTSGLENLE